MNERFFQCCSSLVEAEEDAERDRLSRELTKKKTTDDLDGEINSDFLYLKNGIM